MKKILFSCFVLSIVFIYSVGLCTYPEESPKTDSSPGNSLFTKYEDDLLSVDIKDVPLADVLQKLSDETGILFSFPPAIGEESVMVRFSNFTMPDALNKILSSHDRIFIYEERQSDSDESIPSRLKEVRIFTPLPQGATRGTAKGTSSDPPTVINSKSSEPTQIAKNNAVQRKAGKRPSGRTGKRQTVASLGDDLKNSDTNVRLEAIRRLGSIGNADAIGHLTTALEDRDPDVKEAAKNALQELQDENQPPDSGSNKDTEDNEPIDGAPAYGIELMSQDSGSVQLSVNLSDVPESLITAGLWIEYDASQMSIVSADINMGDNAWDEGMSQTVKDPKGPGTYMITAGNLSTVNPDDNSSIDLANIQFQCISGNCSGQTVTVGPVEDPNFDSVVGTKGGVYDSKMNKQTYTIL
jgi:hypothetical protein